ncbi:MAG: hypothetical protein AAFV07_02675 [Bacteroidota bacterium]
MLLSMTYTHIDLAGIVILEPVTSLTDLLTASVCFFAYWQLRKFQPSHWPTKALRYYFLCMGGAVGISAVIGHAFLYALTPNWKMLGWTCSGLSIFFIGRSSILRLQEVFPDKILHIVTLWPVVQYVIFMVAIIWPETRSFDTVKLNATLGMTLIAIPLQYIIWYKTRHPGHLRFAVGLSMGIFPAIVFNNQITLHTWFNYHDLSHVLMAISMFVQFTGVRMIHNTSKVLFPAKPIPATG